MWLKRETKNIHRILVGNLKKDTPLDDVGRSGKTTSNKSSRNRMAGQVLD